MPDSFETIILRFRDLVTAENKTIEEHSAIIAKEGYVWWAWWKKGHEQTPFTEFAMLGESARTTPLMVYLVDSGKRKNAVYHAMCADIKLDKSTTILSPNKDKTPEYYRDQEYCAWFKFTKIESCEDIELGRFSYVDCKSLFTDKDTDYSMFDSKKIHSIQELVQQNRTVWFVRKARYSDRDNEIVLLNSDLIQPAHFSKKYHQSSGDTIIWLSDLHLSDHLFKPESGSILREQALSQCILKCLKRYNVAVAGLVISGDITSRAEKDGFQYAKELLKNLNSEIPGLNPENILICPGNHDFAREHEKLPSEKEPAFIYERPDNAAGFIDFYHSIYKLNPNHYFASGKKLLLSSGHLVEIAALNSLVLQQYPNFEGHGYISQEQLEFVADSMGWNSGTHQNAVRIVMMHHHYLPTCYTEIIDVAKASSVVYDADRLMKWLIEYNVKVLIHGHKHTSFVAQVNYPAKSEDNIDIDNMQRIAVAGMGGTGASGTDNKFAAIHFKDHEMVIDFYRIYSDRSTQGNLCQTIKILL